MILGARAQLGEVFIVPILSSRVVTPPHRTPSCLLPSLTRGTTPLRHLQYGAGRNNWSILTLPCFISHRRRALRRRRRRALLVHTAPRPVNCRGDQPPLLRIKVYDSSECPSAASDAQHQHRRPPLPLPRPRALTGSLASVWWEGLFLVLSITAAALSWYTQLRARSFAEAHLLPAACAMLREYLQREVRIGKVRSVSPLGIPIHIGPHAEEFSCGEVPVMKIRIRPFASLRRGRVVVDALLSDPTALVAQKKDFSWLGIPAPSEGTLKRNSEEEGIDYRTKTRRLAREQGGEQWNAQRDRTAREAPERDT